MNGWKAQIQIRSSSFQFISKEHVVINGVPLLREARRKLLLHHKKRKYHLEKKTNEPNQNQTNS